MPTPEEILAARRAAYAAMSAGEKRARRARESAAEKERRKNETPEQREARLAAGRARARAAIGLFSIPVATVFEEKLA